MLKSLPGWQNTKTSIPLVMMAVFLLMPAPGRAQGVCAGDCDNSGTVTISELVVLVNVVMDLEDMSRCPAADTDDNGEVSINELVAAVNAVLDGCSVGPTPTRTPGSGCSATPFASTFEAIQKVVFEKRGCTEQACHGSPGVQGGLNLSPDVAYENLVEVSSTGIAMDRVTPGDKDRSYLWLKLAAATDPSLLPVGFQINGAPMPNGLPPITADELEALRLWIYNGAPKEGTVEGTAALLDACLPPQGPILITPLEPPAPGTGVQLTMPPWPLEAHSEREICFATYYDITDQVPKQYQDPSGTLFRFSSSELRQDPQSHHLILNRYFGTEADIHDESLGQWTCAGGARTGQTCEPTDRTSCGEGGFCRSQIRQSFACIGFGPSPSRSSGDGQGGLNLGNFYAIGGAQAAQSHNEFVEGVFAQIPMKGILYWNSHAFNLTAEDTTMHGWLNYYFSDDQRYPVQGIFNISQIFAANAPPFTKQTLCNDHVLPRGARLFSLSSHTHRHGQHFTVTVADGSTIYESFIYNDPADVTFDPPILFDSPDRAQRTLRYCSLFNNGVKPDGTPDVDLVTRHSRVPPQGFDCTPTACVSGKIAAPCSGQTQSEKDASCDSTPGAGDGFCDACPITGGESTENEMFILIGSYFRISGAAGEGEAARLDESGRSSSTEVALPPQMGCSSSHAGHQGH